nr:hypothetical protein [uncultured Brevundimonas sp.]
MKRIDLSTAALRLHRIDKPEDTAAGIDDLVVLALRRRPKSPRDAASLIDLVISSLQRDQQPRLDRADLNALKAVRAYILKASQ